MDFISNSEFQIREMLTEMGLKSIEELFSAIPSKIKLPPLHCDDGLSELEGMRLIEKLGRKNTFSEFTSYLGAGSYAHHIPAIVPFIASKSEFLTSYTPYQAEASQGSLQVIYEYQSAINALTGMQASNASVWDGAIACAEGVLMAARIKPERKKFLIADTLNPSYFAVIEQYTKNSHLEILKIPFKESGQLDLEVFKQLNSAEVVGILVQSPNLLGVIEDMKEIVKISKSYEALTLQCANPLSYGLYESPGALGVDIAVGDLQPLGLSLNFGGPYAGYMATKAEFMRQLPGRIAGKTKDSIGKTAYTLVLQAREQHIRREKALSNICTNQALCALSSLVTLLWYGKNGLIELAKTNFKRASYLKSILKNTLEGPIFNEFTWKLEKPLPEVLDHFRKAGIEPGWPCPLLENHLVISVTELKTKQELDRFAEVAYGLF